MTPSFDCPLPDPPLRPPFSVPRLAALILARFGPPAAGHYQRAEGSPFWPLFAAATAEFDDPAATGRVYAGSFRVLARMVTDGAVRGTADFLRLGRAVVRTLGTHERVRAYHKGRPLLPWDGTVDRFGEPVRRPLVAAGVDPAGAAGRADDPVEGAAYPELLAAVRREARTVGRLHLRAEHLYRRFEFATGSARGAYVYLAAMAVTDPGTGRVVAFRPWRAEPAPVPPPRAVYRQVRRIHAEARIHIRAAAGRLKVTVQPGY